MEITGKIIRVFEPQSGTSKAGREWKKREYLLEVPSNNPEFAPRQVFFNFFGTRADEFVLEGGKNYRVQFDIESREFNGRWYTDIRAYRAEPVAEGTATTQPQPQAPVAPANDPFAPAPTFNGSNDFLSESPTDDLPF